MAANIAVGFQLTANAAGMAQGINAGVVELQKLGLAAKKTQGDVRLLTGLSLGTAFVGGIRALSAAIGQANQLLSGFVNESIAIGEAAQRSNVIFEDSADAVRKFAQSGSAIGLSEKAALQATARFGTLFQTIGLATDEAAEYSTRLVQLASDLASFSDTSVDDALRALSSALVGEFEPIRRYGVLLNEATLKQTALQLGIRKTTGTLDPQTKLLASYSQILRQTSIQQGDFERTSNQLANQQRILGAEWDNIRATIGDALQPAYRAIVQTLRESLPAIRQAGQELAAFVAGVDFSSISAGIVTTLAGAAQSLADAFSIASAVVTPLANTVFPAISATLSFISRNLVGAASGAALASAGLVAYSLAAGGAAAATALFSAALTALLSRTGIGLLAVTLGSLYGAYLQYSATATDANQQVQSETAKTTEEIGKLEARIQSATNSAGAFGAKVQAAVKIPDLSLGDIAQDSINAAQSAIAGLAKELGGTVNVPRELVAQFNTIQNLAERANDDFVNQRVLLMQLTQESNRFADAVKAITERRQEDIRAAKEAAEATRRAAEDARKRTSELAKEGLGGSEASRLKLSEDLLAVDRERKAAEEALASARRANDNAGIAAAKERFGLAVAAADTARKQDRERQLQALGIDNDLLKPAKTIGEEFAKVRDAFKQKLIDPGEAKNALRNLAKEGIKIRRDLNAELARPSRQALEVQDIRNGGIAEFLRLATGREDPAIEQNRQQLKELSRIRQGLERIGVRPVDILGT